MNKVIAKMLSAGSWQELDGVIAERIAEEKQEYNDFYAGENGKGGKYHSFITPPSSANDLSLHTIETFLHPELTEIFISTYPSYSYRFDDENEIYRLFASELSKVKNPNDFKQLASAVSETIFEYIGGAKVNGDDYDRMALLKKPEALDDGEKNNFSVFKNSGKAWCVERSCIAQQLFKFAGLESKMIMATISNNGEKQIHCFNLVKDNKKTFLFDSAVMTYPKEGEKYNAVASVLPEEVFDKNLVGVDEVPTRQVVGKSGRTYNIVYDLKNRELQENAKIPNME